LSWWFYCFPSKGGVINLVYGSNRYWREADRVDATFILSLLSNPSGDFVMGVLILWWLHWVLELLS
jgi:hypothetical protein